MIDSQGNLYGTTSGSLGSCGLIFKFDSAGVETVLYAFNCVVGNGPNGPLVLDGQGNLYGTVLGGGVAYDSGIVFKLDREGKLTVLHSFFRNGGDGYSPYAGLVRDRSGNLYGTTYYGGTGRCGTEYTGCGVVFEIAP